MRERRHTLNGGFAGAPTALSRQWRTSYKDAEAFNPEGGNNNAWRGSLSATANNNKNNNNWARPVAALGVYDLFYLSVIEAYHDCLKHKLSKRQTMEYMPIAADDLPHLAREMWTGEYRPTTSTCFMVKHPKLREVFAAAFRDRIVHHWICLRIVPVYERIMNWLGNPNHACRKGFGNRTAIAQVESAMERISRGYRRQAWVYRGDVVSFFMSIDKRIMLRLAIGLVESNRHLWQPWEYQILLRLLRVTILHRPDRDCVINSQVELWRNIESSKSMFYVDPSKSMPIGNLTTQILAGLYMLPFIQRMHSLFSQRFGAFWQSEVSLTVSVDDFVIVCSNRGALRWLVREAENFLSDRLRLKCHSEKTYLQPVSHGVKFLGQWIKPHRRYIINRTANRFSAKVKAVDQTLHERHLFPSEAESVCSSINSYLGLLKGTRSRKIINRTMKSVSKRFNETFIITDNKITVRKWTRTNSKSCANAASSTGGYGLSTTKTGRVANPHTPLPPSLPKKLSAQPSSK